MVSFDFISGEDFRNSLENDYQELKKSMEVGAWKAVHVLAGSIIEALLIDYLVSINYQIEDPLRISLDKAINICRKEGILSEKAEHISHAIRSYRNLIHPGRSIRLDEVADESGAKIAQGLVDMIISEVATNKQRKFGYTAEQIIKKIQNDTSTVSILGHLLKQTTENEKLRLLVQIIPQTYVEYSNLDEPVSPSLYTSLTACYRIVSENASIETKKKTAKHLIKVIAEESQETAYIYLFKFFRAADLQYLAQEDIILVKQYLFSIMEKKIDDSLLDSLSGIGAYLDPQDIWPLMTPLLKVLFAKQSYLIETVDLKAFLFGEYGNMNEEVKDKISSILQERSWSRLSETGKEMLKDLRDFVDVLENPSDPFLPDFPDE